MCIFLTCLYLSDHLFTLEPGLLTCTNYVNEPSWLIDSSFSTVLLKRLSALCRKPLTKKSSGKRHKSLRSAKLLTGAAFPNIVRVRSQRHPRIRLRTKQHFYTTSPTAPPGGSPHQLAVHLPQISQHLPRVDAFKEGARPGRLETSNVVCGVKQRNSRRDPMPARGCVGLARGFSCQVPAASLELRGCGEARRAPSAPPN